MVGGSTTECGALAESEGIHAILSAHLNEKAGLDKTIRVYNAGVPGHKSDDHISWMAHRIVHLRPDMVVVFAGINDLLAAIVNFDYLHINVPPQSRTLLARMVSTEFQIPRRLFYLYNRIANPSDQEVMERVGAITNYHEKIAVRKSSPQAAEPPRTDIAPFEANLVTMAGMARAHDFRLVLMTQQSTWASDVDPEASQWHWVRCREGKTYREEDMDAALGAYNNATRRVGADLNIPVFDFAAHCPRSTQYFYDEIHFNVKGAEEAGRTLADFILENGLLPLRAPADAPNTDRPTD
jgi:lysophospholipase L1-like esterase